MENDTRCSTSGLVFLGTRDIDIVAICNAIGGVLEADGHRVNGLRIGSHTVGTIRAIGFDIGVALLLPGEGTDTDPGQPQVLQIGLRPNHSTAAPTRAAAEAVLAMVTRALALELAPERVQWLRPEAALDTRAFLAAFDVVRPRRVRRRGAHHQRPAPVLTAARARPAAPDPAPTLPPAPVLSPAFALPASTPRGFPEVESSFDLLHDRMMAAATGDQLRAVFLDDADDQASPPDRPTPAPLRLAAWLMAISVGLFALPLAAALVVLNLLRGEDLRRAAQAMSLTGLFLALNSSGATAQTLGTLSALLG